MEFNGMNIDLKNIPAKALELIDKLKEYVFFICILLVLLAYGYLVLQIRGYVVAEPSQQAVTEKLSELNIPKIDDQVIEKVKQLENSNVEVKALFDEARDNPFQE